VMKDALKIG
jgi:hypothetical protein